MAQTHALYVKCHGITFVVSENHINSVLLDLIRGMLLLPCMSL